jgi:hypothetical protein
VLPAGLLIELLVVTASHLQHSELSERRCVLIAMPRTLARSFRTVLRRCLSEPGSRGELPLMLVHADDHQLTLQACRSEIAVRFGPPPARATSSLAFRATVLARFQGRTEASVTLDEVASGRGRATWNEGGVPQTVDFETVDPAKVPKLPELPTRLAALSEDFLTALGEASRTTARESTRFGVTRVQVRGQSGQVVATDGRQLLIQGGFQFPWQETILVARLPLLDLPGMNLSGPVGLVRTQDHVLLRAGDWCFWLKIDSQSRFPPVEDAIPKGNGTSRLRLDPQDARFLASALPKLPGRDDDHSPVTLQLASPPAVRARSGRDGPATEIVLARSTASGPPIRIATDRHYLLRAAQMGFSEIAVLRPDVPLVCRDESRTFVWMPLDANGVVLPGKEVVRLVSAEGTEITPDHPSPPRRRSPMPVSAGNGNPPPEDRLPPGPPNAGFDDLIAESEALRHLLADASARAHRLVAALKQHRRQAKAVRAAVASLRGLQLDG